MNNLIKKYQDDIYGDMCNFIHDTEYIDLSAIHIFTYYIHSSNVASGFINMNPKDSDIIEIALENAREKFKLKYIEYFI